MFFKILFIFFIYSHAVIEEGSVFFISDVILSYIQLILGFFLIIIPLKKNQKQAKVRVV